MKPSYDIVAANEVALLKQILPDKRRGLASNSADTEASMRLLVLTALKVAGTSAPNEVVVDRKKLQP